MFVEIILSKYFKRENLCGQLLVDIDNICKLYEHNVYFLIGCAYSFFFIFLFQIIDIFHAPVLNFMKDGCER